MLAEAVFFWVLFIGALYLFIGFLIVPNIAEAKLEKLCGGTVSIHSGRFKGLDKIRLKGVVVAENYYALTDAPILHADEIEVRFNPSHLLRGRFNIDSITLKDFLLTADYDPELKKWNLGQLSFQKSRASKQNKIPEMIFKRGALRLRSTDTPEASNIVTIGINGEVTSQKPKGQYAIFFETDGRFGFGSSRLEGGIQIPQKDADGRFWLSGQVQLPQTGILQNKWSLDDIQLECSFNEQLIAVQKCNFAIGPGRAKIKGQIYNTENWPMTADLELMGFEISDHDKPGAIVYGQLYKFLGPELSRFIKRYHPCGTSEVEMKINSDLTDLTAAQFHGLIRCTDISVMDEMFPYPLVNMKGDIVFTGRDLQVDLSTRHNEVQMRIKSAINNFGPRVQIDTITTSENMLLDDDVYHAITDPRRDPDGTQAKAWYMFVPKGSTQFEYHYQRSSDGQKNFKTILNLTDISAVYKNFQYPLRHLTGTVVIEPNQVQLTNIRSESEDGSQIEINGEILNPKDDDRDYSISCRGVGVPIDSKLINAFGPTQRAFFDELEVEAVADFHIDLFPDPDDTLRIDYSADVEISGQSFKLDSFPLPMTDVALSAVINTDQVDIISFDAQTECGRLNLNQSKLWPEGNNPDRFGYCMNLDMRDFDLNESFWQAVRSSPDQRFGHKLRILGVVDVSGVLQANVPETLCQEADFTIDFTGNPLQWDAMDIGRMKGRLTANDAGMTFTEFALTKIPLETLPQDIMSKKGQMVYAALSPKGLAAVRIQDGSVQFGPQGFAGIDIQGGIDSNGLSLGRNGLINEVHGTCQGHFIFDSKTGLSKTQARYEIDQFLYQNWLVTDLTGNLVYDPNSRHFKSDDLTAQFYDGTLTGNLDVNVSGQAPAAYILDLNCDNVNMNKLVAAAKETTDQEQAVSGTAYGTLALSGDLNDLSHPQGKLDATAVNLKMGRQSLLGKILTAVQLKRPENYVFTQIDCTAHILGPQLTLEPITMIGNPLVFEGTGDVDLNTRQMTMKLAAWDRPADDQQNIVDMLARGLGSILWKVEINGDINAPQVNAVYLSIFKQPMDIFKEEQ